MPDPGKTVPAEVRYELRIQHGPYKFKVAGEQFDVGVDSDIVVVARVVTSGRMIVEEKIVAVVGDEWRSGCTEFLRLRKFLNDGGVIGLNKDLVY